MIATEEIESLTADLEGQGPESILNWAWARFHGRAAIGTSFQASGLVIMHLAKANALPFPVFTLDTGLLFPETLALRERLETFFSCRIEAVAPAETVAEQADTHGPELWARDPDLCCTLRKVQPLRGKLARLDCWITGLRRDQSAQRADTAVLEAFELEPGAGREVFKLNPLAAWTREMVWDYVRQHGIPYNPLHDQGIRSIGCQPCTRRAGAGEHERAGRWTGFEKTECGIHTFLAKRA